MSDEELYFLTTSCSFNVAILLWSRDLIYENLIQLQVINSLTVGNGPRVLLFFVKVNTLRKKKKDGQAIWSFIRCTYLFPEGWLQVGGNGGKKSRGHRTEDTQAVNINIIEEYERSSS